MAGHYAVTITAVRTEVEPGRLAERLAGLLDESVGDIEERVRDQTVVVEGGLDYREATEIQRELGRRQIPSEVVSEQKLSGDEPELETPDEAGDEPEESPGDERPEISEEHEGAGSEEAGETGAGAEASETPDEAGDEPASDADGDAGAWAELFPDLAQEDVESSGASGSEPDSDSENAAGEGPSRPADSPGEASVPDESEPGGGAEGFAELEEELLRVGQEESDGDAGGAPESGGSSRGETGTSEGSSESDSGEFDAGKIRRAFAAGGDERPPYEPEGFDQRSPHVPLVAALLSLVAPGAGQVYNGRPEKARKYAWTFFLLYPWFQSVREAWSYGEKVRTYYAPRPEEGTGATAVMHGVKWWLVVALLGVITGVVANEIVEHREREAQRRAQRTLQQLRYVGDEEVAAGVSRAREAAEEAADEIETEREEGEYTMDDQERARRLFILGYHYCKGGEYELCDEMMKRVTSLAPDNRDAYDIQTWANLRAQGVGEDREMPEVDGEVPTLERFEVELAAEGRELEDIDRQFGSWWDSGGKEAVAEERGEQEADEPESDRAGSEPEESERDFEERVEDFEIGE